MDRHGSAPASLAQQRLWFLSQLGDAGTAYHVHAGVRIGGLLQRQALIDSLDLIVQRHDVLRTTFRQDDDIAAQVIHGDTSGLFLREHDLTDRQAPGDELQHLILLELRDRFDLEQGPAIRGRLIRLSAVEHVLLITLHHIICDAWSMGVLMNELSALYAALSSGACNPLPPLRVQYADYALCQHRRLQGEALRAQLEYWRDRLNDAPPLLTVPSDRSRPPVQDYRGASVPVTLGEALARQLKVLSRQHGTTLFMTLLAAWGLLLSRLAGQRSVVIGVPVANRTRRELEGLIGLFVNTLPVRIDASEGMSAADLLRHVRTRMLEAQAHADVPFEQIVERLRPVRTLAHSPLFQGIFVWQNAPPGRLRMPGLSLEWLSTPAETAQFDLALSLGEENDRITGSLCYATTLYEAATVERYARCWRELLEGIVADPSAEAAQIELLPESERDLVLRQFNCTSAGFPIQCCIHELFEQQVARTPQAIALVCEDTQISYRELNERANRLAHHLRAQGVGPETRVGVCIERGLSMVVALLATLKAGGAYVPLEPAYPPRRLSFMLADSRAVVLLHTASALLPADAPLPPACIDIERDCSRWSRCSARNLPTGDVGLESRHPAYVIYTSGSTGMPKGAVNEHRSIVNRLLWMQKAYELDARDTVLQKTPFSFDVSVWEIYWPVLAGARLIIAKPQGQRDPAYLMELIERHEVTTLHFVPSMLQAFLEQCAAGRCAPLARVFCSGEALSAAQVGRLTAQLPDARLYNLYGPTEAAVDVTAFACRDLSGQGGVPIGRPISNTRIYILDEHDRPVPIGVAGEICIGGVAVARGYFGNPELTARRFVPDSFAEPGARLYRTGDVGRWLSGGNVEFLGRNDDQVKIRGCRIELAEIEAQLRCHERVKEAVVLARQDPSRGPFLTAYFTVTAQDAAAIATLRTYLSQRLPEYMVPAAFVALDSIPLMPNGKVDRRALPAPGADGYCRHSYEPPRDEIERTLAQIWEKLLGVAQVGRHDSFFDLGGHSLLALRCIEQARSRGIRLSLTCLFEQPTIASLAACSRLGHEQLPSCVVVIREGELREGLFFVHDVSGDPAAYSALAALLPARYTLYGLQAADLDSNEQLSIAAMAARYVRAVRHVQPRGPYRIAGWSIGGLIAQEMACQLEAVCDELVFVGLIDSYPRGGAPCQTGQHEDADGPSLPDADSETAAMRRRLVLAGRSHVPRQVRAALHLFYASQSSGLARNRSDLNAFGTRLTLRQIPGDHWTIMRPPAVATLSAEMTSALHAPAYEPPGSSQGAGVR